VTRQIQDVMTRQVHAVRKDASLRDVAHLMHDRDIGFVLVTNEDGTLYGVATDRDVIVRGLATARDVDRMQIAEICSRSLATLPPTASLDDALKLMRERAVRRAPVVTAGKAVGVVTLGDLARTRDPHSVLAQISASSPNR
jgi:CBS domain-containing protein